MYPFLVFLLTACTDSNRENFFARTTSTSRLFTPSLRREISQHTLLPREPATAFNASPANWTLEQHAARRAMGFALLSPPVWVRPLMERLLRGKQAPTRPPRAPRSPAASPQRRLALHRRRRDQPEEDGIVGLAPRPTRQRPALSPPPCQPLVCHASDVPNRSKNERSSSACAC